MNPSNFDELTKALASSTSRRQALRLIVTTSVGGLLGIGGISTAFGRHRRRKDRITAPSGPKGNRNCAKWCAQVFGPNTPAAGQCTSDAAHGRGLCSTCGTADPSSICCVRNTSGFCSGTSAARCPCDSAQCETCDVTHGTCDGCASGHTCCNGTCCDSGEVCQNGTTCVCVPDCTGPCGGNDGCGGICQTGTCPSGQTCVTGSCCHNRATTCSQDADCCSNRCINGLCATPCSNPTPCNNGTCGDCGCIGHGVDAICGCTNSGQGSCTSDANCPQGQFCNAFAHFCHPIC